MKYRKQTHGWSHVSSCYNAGFRDPLWPESGPKLWFLLGSLEAAEVRVESCIPLGSRAKTLKPEGTGSLWISPCSSLS